MKHMKAMRLGFSDQLRAAPLHVLHGKTAFNPTSAVQSNRGLRRLHGCRHIRMKYQPKNGSYPCLVVGQLVELAPSLRARSATWPTAGISAQSQSPTGWPIQNTQGLMIRFTSEIRGFDCRFKADLPRSLSGELYLAKKRPRTGWCAAGKARGSGELAQNPYSSET